MNTTQPEGWVHRHPVRVEFDEVDQYGIVHHARYWIYCERARVELMGTLGMRADSLDGLPVFEEVLQDSASEPLTGGTVRSELEAEVEFERKLLLSNSLKAIEQLHDRLSSEQCSRLAELLDRVAETTGDEEMRLEASALGQRLQAGD